MQKINKLSTTLILAPFIFTFAFALDVYVPSIKGYFATSPVMVQLTVGLFLLLAGVG